MLFSNALTTADRLFRLRSREVRFNQTVIWRSNLRVKSVAYSQRLNKKSPHATPKPPVYVNMYKPLVLAIQLICCAGLIEVFNEQGAATMCVHSELPGYWAFCVRIKDTCLHIKSYLGLFCCSMSEPAVVLVGLASQDTYSQLSTLLDKHRQWVGLGWQNKLVTSNNAYLAA